MDNIKLEKIKSPFSEDIHRFSKYLEGLTGFDTSRWVDIYGIQYRVVGNTLIITNPQNNQLIPDSIVLHVNALPEGVKVVFNLTDSFSVTGLNLLLEAFTNKESNKSIVIDVTRMNMRIRDNISLWSLPDNIKISNTVSLSETPYFGENDFDWWLLRRSDDDFYRVLSKLDKDSFDRATALESIAFKFYSEYGDTLEKMNDKCKCLTAFNWVRNNTRFAGSTIIAGEERPISCEHADPITTYRTGMGVCTGRARLFKCLLSNRYLNIDCYLVNGIHVRTRHEWNEVCFSDGSRLYYDINFGLNGRTILDDCYSNIDYSDRRENSNDAGSNYLELPPRRDRLPKQNKKKIKIIPPLPPRRDK